MLLSRAGNGDRDQRSEGRGLIVSKLTDCDGENSETDSALDFAKDCGYITESRHSELTAACHEVGKMLGAMILHPTPLLSSDL